MKTKDKRLFLYEEAMLLALRDEKGTVMTSFPDQVVAGAVLAELLLDGRISVEDNKKQLVDVLHDGQLGDPLMDECLEKIASSKRRASVRTWVSRLAGIKHLRHRVAKQLCERGILRADEDKILLLFKRKIYPEINSQPERRIISRLREAIFTDRRQLDPRTVVLISLADGAGLLAQNFGRKEIKTRKKRIEQIASGDLLGRTTRDVIAACQTALIVAAVMPAIVSTTVHN
ncbi:MAG: GPP34 family phosphoprotein [Gammaproteobacteria bacterium]|nr:GPP34 family phosphoprotein [Gammaproteobacteria bacterium]